MESAGEAGGFLDGPAQSEAGVAAVQTPAKAPLVCLEFAGKSTSEPPSTPIHDHIGWHNMSVPRDFRTYVGGLRIRIEDALRHVVANKHSPHHLVHGFAMRH